MKALMNRVKSDKLQDEHRDGEGSPVYQDTKLILRITTISWDRFYDDEFLGYEAFIIRLEDPLAPVPFANI